ncbi:MAG: SpoIIE family protein phosphatase [Bacteroidota bacterium]|jgi:serine phosphatase RsbU (regulator of sigma subunit)/HAMP domain-containing protein
MNFQFTIGRKLGFGFGIIIFLTVVAFTLTNYTLTESKSEIDEMVNNVIPSVAKFEELKSELLHSVNLITRWKHESSQASFKDSLRILIKVNHPQIKKDLKALESGWDDKTKLSITKISKQTDELFLYYDSEIMSRFVSMDNYNDAMLDATANDALDNINISKDSILQNLDHVIYDQKKRADEKKTKMIKSFDFLGLFVKFLGVMLVVGGILTAILTVRSIVKPVKFLKGQLNKMSLGVLPTERIPPRNDEIGDMNTALNQLVDSMERTTEFARQVGSGNFESYYKPLSEQDTLGHALLRMRKDLHENERVLEQKVIERTEEVVRQKEEIENKNQELEILYKHVTDSIRYAKRIQEAILPPDSMVKKLLPQSFILYKPKDIVSGDFYWVDEKEGKIFYAAVDCTGHGVPGAFMSIVGYNLLKEIIVKPTVNTPAQVMQKMKTGVSKTLHHGQSEDNAKDGMDMTMCAIDFNNMFMHFSGAYNPMYLIRDGELTQYDGDSFPVGLMEGMEDKHFTDHKIELKKNDMIYIFSDGYADQFGGPRGKKFMISKFRDLLKKSSLMPIEEQKDFLLRTIEDWRGDLEQVDDILVIGVRV